VCASSVYDPRVDKLDKLGQYYNAINSTLVQPNVMIVAPFASHVVPLNKITVVPFTIVVPLRVLHLWRLGIENGR